MQGWKPNTAHPKIAPLSGIGLFLQLFKFSLVQMEKLTKCEFPSFFHTGYQKEGQRSGEQ